MWLDFAKNYFLEAYINYVNFYRTNADEKRPLLLDFVHLKLAASLWGEMTGLYTRETEIGLCILIVLVYHYALNIFPRMSKSKSKMSNKFKASWQFKFEMGGNSSAFEIQSVVFDIGISILLNNDLR